MVLLYVRDTSASAVLNTRLSADPTTKNALRKRTANWKYLTTYPQMANFLSEKYRTVKIIAETESVIIPFAQPAGMVQPQYADELAVLTFRLRRCVKVIRFQEDLYRRTRLVRTMNGARFLGCYERDDIMSPPIPRGFTDDSARETHVVQKDTISVSGADCDNALGPHGK